MRRSIPYVAASITLLTLAATQTPAQASGAGSGRAETVIEVSDTPIAGEVPREIIGANHRWPDKGFGMWDDATGEPVPRMVDLAKQTGVGLIRYPGGTVANLFDWKKSIGPQAGRGCQVGGGFVGGAEPMDSVYGPDENERFVDRIGAETMIMTNATTQTVADAADFVEYLNAPVGSNPNGGKDWAKVRAANGHAEPYGIKVWELGNELYLGNQRYWRAENLDTRLRQYVLGGTQRQLAQPVGKACDHRDSASVSSGAAGQRFQVWYPPVVPGSQKVRVGGADWRAVADLGKAGPGDAVYSINAKTGEIRFGDGKHGRIPAKGQKITADYGSGPHPGFVDYYKAMKKADPSIDICSAWETTKFVELMGADKPYDCVGVHLYARPDVTGAPEQVHDGQMPLAEKVVRDELDELTAAIDRFRPGQDRPYLEVSEYGQIKKPDSGPAPQGWAGSVSTTLIHADLLAGMIEHGTPLGISSNLNAGSTTPGELFGGAPDFVDTARARMLKLAGELVGTRPVRNEVVNNPAGDGDFKALRVLTTRGSDGAVRLLVLNRDRDTPVTANVALPGSGEVEVHTLNGAGIASFNTKDDPDAVKTTTTTAPRTGTGVEHTFPAHSITLIEAPAP
ncbi:hypothetical protein AB0I81_33565 [Nonomuraea sp. NPDC050404]|uniref:hypothetical protein n=1 Tax=Nonomuraea sp. NPDC050404 TaxID=3155783 RepID=UPI0033CD1C58